VQQLLTVVLFGLAIVAMTVGGYALERSANGSPMIHHQLVDFGYRGEVYAGPCKDC